MAARWPKEQIDFIRSVAEGKYNDEIADLFNEKFGTDVSSKTIKQIKQNHKIRSNVSRGNRKYQRTLLTDDQLDYLRKIASGRLTQEIKQLMFEKFGLSLTIRQIAGQKKRAGIVSSVDTRFPAGNIPINKGTKGMFNVGGNITSFKKGHRPHNYKPIGTEVFKNDGYWWVKIADPNKWKEKHRVMWEQEYGPIPKDNVIVFKDNNSNNCILDNLAMISKSQHAILNKNGWRFDDPELLETSLLLADLKSARTKVKKNEKGK